MPGGHRARDTANLKVQMLTAILKLSKFNIPVAAVWYHENTIQVEGTEALKKLLDDMKDGALERAVKEDVLQFSAPEPADPPCDVPVDIPVREQAFNLLTATEPEKLPFPLSCMNKKEKLPG